MTLTINEYQKRAMRTSRSDMSQEEHVLNAMLGLAGEAGECCDLVKKHNYQDGRNIYNDLIDELGDVLWYVAEAANALDITLESVALHNINKLKKRYPYGFDVDKSLNREV